MNRHTEAVATQLTAWTAVSDVKRSGDNTRLVAACHEGNIAVVSELLRARADADETNADHLTPLSVASRKGHTATVTTLLRAGAKVDKNNIQVVGGATPLCFASHYGHVAVVSELLKARAATNHVFTNGETPIFSASRQGHTAVVSLLLKAGAAINDSNGNTRPLIIASSHGHAAVVSALLKADASVNAKRRDGYTSLFMASQHGHNQTVAALLQAGAEVDAKCLSDCTALIAASQQGHAAIVNMLLTARAQVNAHLTDSGDTAMIFACYHGHLATVKVLSSHDAARTISDAQHGDQCADVLAALQGHDDVVAWLGESRQWITPLHHLRIIGAVRARELLRDGANLHAAAAGGPTPLSLAQALQKKGETDVTSAAWLVLEASEPWNPSRHGLFPTPSRTFAVELLHIGYQLSRQPQFAGESRAIADVWLEYVMPKAVER